MLIKQRVPNFIDLDPDHEFPIHNVSTIEEFLAIDFVQRRQSFESFDYFSYVPRPHNMGEVLMANNKDGTFWAIAVIKEGSLADFGFPIWVDSKDRKV